MTFACTAAYTTKKNLAAKIGLNFAVSNDGLFFGQGTGSS